MPRYALKIEYDGTLFSGWQRQKDQPSVQETIERALARLDPAGPLIAGAGRTDSGVHATGQIAHVDLARDWQPFRLMEALNYHLRPAPVAIVAIAPVAGDFHARFSARERHYLFRLITRRAPLVLERGRVWHVNRPLALEPMQQAAQMLVGHHDFTTFRSTQCQAKSPLKTLDELRISAHPVAHGVELRFHLRARSFLHNQVRSIVGTLERVGIGAWRPEDVRAALLARDRTACGPVSPPQGLYLTQVDYPVPPRFDATAMPAVPG